ncbi:MAG: IS1 family transposase [Cyanobacteria bacterium J06642_2]
MYLRYRLSYRDVQQMLGERGVEVDHSSIYRWVQCYSPELDERCRSRYQVVSKQSGKTGYIERFNCTLRQRVSQFVRRNLVFSKCVFNHVGVLWSFIHHYNASLLL